MINQETEFRQKLLNAQPMSPVLRASYEEELDRMLHPKLTMRSAWIGVALLVMLVAFTLALVRNIFVFKPDLLTLTGWSVLAVAFSYASYLIVRDLWQRKHSPKSVSSIAQALCFAAGTLTAVTLLLGLQEPSDPASTFKAFFVFVFYVACLSWSIESRIAAAELASREQSLRIEFRLADLADKLERAKQ